MKISADYTKVCGKIKPMHAVGQAPLDGAGSGALGYMTKAGIPYSRLHDVYGMFGMDMFCDVPNIFRDFDADVNDPASYSFAFTDVMLKMLNDAGVKPFYRLGVTIENFHDLEARRIFPPKDMQKWAEICEHIVRHYNEGWANGFHMGIEYWEIWNEPDGSTPFNGNKGPMWHGTDEEYFELYKVASKHLKKCFGDSIKVGGYAAMGFYSWKSDPDLTRLTGKGSAKNDGEFYIEFAHRFLEFVKKNECPLDFYSWHCYNEDANFMAACSDYCRRLLDLHGFSDVPDILDEWNSHISDRDRDSAYGAAKNFASLLRMQKSGTSMLCYYDARMTACVYAGLFNPDSFSVYRSYYAFLSFNTAYKYGNEVETDSDCADVFCVGAVSDKGEKVLLIANRLDKEVKAETCVVGASLDKAEYYVTDKERRYEKCSLSYKDGLLSIPPYACVEIRL